MSDQTTPQTQWSGPIAYPSFREHLETLQKEEEFTPADIAKLVGVEEHTAIAWFDGNPPSKNLHPSIQKELEYSFRERRFAECANAACFPPASAPDEIRAIRSYAALLAYLQDVLHQIPQPALIAFLGWSSVNSSTKTLDGTYTPGSERLTEALRRIPELPRHLRGEVLSPCTPRVVFGDIVSDCRKRRNLSMMAYAQRVKKQWGVPEGVTRGLEEEARGMLSPSKRAAKRERSEGGRGGYFRDLKTVENLVRFLDAERRALGVECEQVPALDRSAPRASPPPLPDTHRDAAVQVTRVAPLTVHHAAADDVLRRLRTLAEQIGSSDATADILGIPKSTVRDALRFDTNTKQATIDRLDAALSRVDAQRNSAQPPPLRPPHSAPPSPVATEGRGEASRGESGSPPSLGSSERARAGQAAAPPPSAPLSSDDLLTRVAAELEDLKAQVARLQGTPRNDNGGTPAADDFPFTRECFREHDEAVGADVLTAITQRMRAVIHDLAYLAGIRDDQRRAEVREHHLRGVVDDLFVAMEGFLKQFPSRALEHLERQRAWTKQHGGVVPPAPSQPRR